MVEQRDIKIILGYPVDWEKFRDKSVLVTGATGRLGMYIVEALSEANIRWNLNIKVLLLARSREKLEKVFKESLQLPFFYLLVRDVIHPIEYSGNVDYIFHTAGLASPKDFTNTPVDTLWGHVQGTRNVLELARLKKSRKVLYVSTVEVYGEWKSEKDISENDMGTMKCDNFRACYPEAKRLCETMLASYEKQYEVDYSIVRLSHTFGPGISLYDGRAFSEFIRCVVEGKDIILQSDGSAVRTYTYVADAVGAMFLVITNGKDKIYNVSNHKNQISILDLAELIAELDPLKKTKVIINKEKRETLAYLPFKLGIMADEKVKKLGWEAKVDVKDAFRWTLDSFLQAK